MYRMANKTRRNRLPRMASTSHMLNEWHEHLFEKLGWMVLAKAKGCSAKVAQYKRSIKHFLAAVDHVAAEYEDHNRKHDLNVLRMNAEALQQYVAKHL